MTDETKAERRRRLARDRQRRRRNALRKHHQKVGATKFRMDLYAGTAAELEFLRQHGGFDEAAELLTLAIHGLADLARRDPAALDFLLRRI